ncbi:MULTISPECIES: hypothetical protein [unclassified Microcoleus]|uniref:hypothetical protein n=1 Tax=unclassified Microcoleus TaxID=2642155 RepID=UPI0025FA7BA9|nr:MULTISPECIES: hypothetical protein [unclassified Microcoleus]
MVDIDVDKYFRESRRCLRPFHVSGEPLIDFLVRVREGNPKKWSFWQMLCHAVKESLVAIVLGINRLSSPPPGPRIEWEAEGTAQPSEIDLEKSIPEVNRWQTLVETFVPVPDSEIGGCARNDSLIAPAIN